MKKVVKLGKHVSPSIPPVLLDTALIEKVTMSCGGGLGGSKWEEYGTFIDEAKPNTLAKFKNYITGEVKVLNTSYVVMIESRKVVKIESDVTQNHNFNHKKTIDYWLMARDKEFIVVDECNVDVDKDDAKLIERTYIY